MAAMVSLQNTGNPNKSHNFSDHTMVYVDLKSRDSGIRAEIVKIGAHFADNNFSRHVCYNGTFGEKNAKQTELSKEAVIHYLGGELVVTVSKTVAWKEFLEFLRSANNSVILVIHDKQDDCFLLLRDLTELSLMDEFRKVCVGVIDTLPLCRKIFPGRNKNKKNYKLKELVKDELGEVNSSPNTTVDAVNLERLMNHANVRPKMLQQHSFTLSYLEYQYQKRRERLLNKEAKRAVEARRTLNDTKRSSVESREDSSGPLHSDRMKATKPKAKRKKTSAVTLDVSKQGKMAATDSLRNDENPNGSHFSDYTMVYFDLVATSAGKRSEVCQIGAHFGESSFSRYVCPHRGFMSSISKQTKLSKKDGILYLEGEQVETVSKMNAWRDFLKFLQSANNSVVLVMHDNQYKVLFRDLSGLSLMDEFRTICVGVIDTLPLCRCIFPARKKIGKNYKLIELVKDKLGGENSSGQHNATVDAVNLEKLMKHAKVEPEIFQEHFVSLSKLEYHYQKNIQPRSRRKKKKRAAIAGITFSDNQMRSLDTGEDSGTSPHSGSMKATEPKVERQKTSAITLDVSKQAKKMTTKDSLHNRENSNRTHHFHDRTMVYLDLAATDFGRDAEVCQIRANFAEKNFSRYVCPIRPFGKRAAKLTRLSREDGVLYLGGERVETVSKMDAWKDFLKFLRSANNSVVLVIHDRFYDYFLLFRDLSKLSMMEEFKKVCVGVIDTLPLCRKIFPGREETGKNSIVKEIVQEKLGEGNSSGSHNATVNAIILEELLKNTKVEPEIFQQYFFSLSNLKYQINRHVRFEKERVERAKRAARAGIIFNDNKRSSVQSGEDSSASPLSGKEKASQPIANGKKTSAVTLDVSRQGKEMKAEDRLQNNENPNGSRRFSDHTMVYFDLEGTGSGGYSEICQIGAHFAENSFSRYVCPIRSFTKVAAELTGFSKKDGILYLRGVRVETVSKMDAWKDFVKFLRSANNSVVLVMHDRHNDCTLLFRDLSELSLMEEFRTVCVGVIDTLPLCQDIFPGRNKAGKNYRLEEVVQDKLGEETSAGSHNALADAINLGKLMKHANVQPEMFEQHFFSLSSLEDWYQTRKQARLLWNKFHFMGLRGAKKMAEAGITYHDLARSYVEGGEDGVASFLSGKMNTMKSDPNAFRERTIAITKVLRKSEIRRNLKNLQP